MRKKDGILYLGLHLGVGVALAAFPLYRLAASRLPAFLVKCFLHDRLFLYCPFCGGTRALGALLRLDLGTAFAANPLVVLLAVSAIVLDVVMLFRLLRRRSPLLPLPHWSWAVFLGVAIVYGVLRNWLMIVHGYDPLGDLGIFWHR